MLVMSRGKWVHGLTWMPRLRRSSLISVRVHDAEVEAELVPHLLLPLDLQRGRADDQNLPGPVADDEFEGHHARLDGLAEAHVVGDQQVDPWHLDRPHHGIKLVVLDVDARAERGLDVPHVGRGGGAPADGIEEGVELVGRIEAGRLGQGDLLDDPGPRLELPDDLSSSPRPSSSTEDSVSRCCGDSRPVCRRSGGSVLADTSVTIQLRDRTLTSCPCSGRGDDDRHTGLSAL